MKLKILKLRNKIFFLIFIYFFGFINFIYANNDFIISEIMYNPIKNNNKKTDWFEIFALNDFLINKKWGVMDEFTVINKKNGKKNTCHALKINNSIKIKKGNRVVFVDNIEHFKKQYPNFKGMAIDTVLNLNSVNKDSIKISFDRCKTFVENIQYNPKNWRNIKGYSLEWNFKNNKWQKSYVLGGTPGKKNSERIKYEKTIKVNEILPNPQGKENKKEYIELYNFGKREINLKNWQLRDSSKNGQYVFLKNTVIKPGDYLVVYRSVFKFALNNAGREEVFLLNPNGELVDSIKYENAKENISYGFDRKNKKWRWSNKLTPGKENIFSKIPKIKIKIDKKIYKNIYADFNVKIKNIDKNKTKISWNFGDNKKSYKAKTRHKYKKTGKYKGYVKITVNGETIDKYFEVEVKKYPKKKVKINAIMPNPEGLDKNKEWIEIKNKTNKKINLKGWIISTGSKRSKLINHLIYKDFIVNPKRSRKITGKFSRFSLNNKRGWVMLKYPDGRIAYKLKYEKKNKIKDNEIYKKTKGARWFWLKFKKDNFTKRINAGNEHKKQLKNSKTTNLNEKVLGKQTVLKRGQKIFFNSNNKTNFAIIFNRIQTNNNKKVREENGVYHFIPRAKKRENNFIKIFKNKL